MGGLRTTLEAGGLRRSLFLKPSRRMDDVQKGPLCWKIMATISPIDSCDYASKTTSDYYIYRRIEAGSRKLLLVSPEARFLPLQFVVLKSCNGGSNSIREISTSSRSAISLKSRSFKWIRGRSAGPRCGLVAALASSSSRATPLFDRSRKGPRG